MRSSQVEKSDLEDLYKTLVAMIRATQGNMDHLQGQVRNLSTAYNLTVDDVIDIETKVNNIIKQLA